MNRLIEHIPSWATFWLPAVAALAVAYAAASLFGR
jgi:hypothetical protein